MKKLKYSHIAIAGAVIVISFVIGIQRINRALEQEVSDLTGESARKKTANVAIDEPIIDRSNLPERELAPTDLTPYRITAQRKSQLFKNQQYWDVLTKDSLEESTAAARIDEGKLFQGTVKTPDEYKDQIRMIDERIKAYKQRIRSDPYDTYAKKKLQDLYLMKSTVRGLKKTLVPEYRNK